ncbi:MAG: signal peptide peptidase SppA [Treponema sp.]|nr:signal peptide peptidase SppA [Treponema sp.]
MTKNAKSGITVFIIIILIAAGCIGYSIYENKKIESKLSYYNNATGNPSGVSSETAVKDKSAGKEYIAALYVEGTIEDENSTYNQKWLLSTINKLTNDHNNIAIALYVNSPGGGVYQADEVYLALQAYKRQDKKLYVFMGPMAASGGYYISCPADKIFANRNTLTGSIGVIAGQLIDATELLDNVGVKIEAIHSGRNKLMGNFYEPATDEQRKILQSVSDECYDQFVSIVAEGRSIPVAKVRELADGRIYTAAQALKLNLIDQIGNWDGMISELRNELSDPACKVVTFHYEHKQTFRESLLGMFSNIKNQEAAAKLGLPRSVMDDLQGFNTYPAYLYR